MISPLIAGSKRVLSNFFAIDLRSIAAFRIALALLLLGDLIDRAQDLRAHYTDWGVLPRGPLVEKFLHLWSFSIHLSSGLGGVQAVLFLAAAAGAVALLVGTRTKLAAFISWVLMVSIQNRNPMVHHSGDDLFRLLLFWSLFLPLGAFASFDSKKNPSPPPPQELSVGTAALLIQIVCVYIFTAFHKSGIEWQNGTAVYYALELDHLILPLGEFLRQFPGLMSFLTYAIYGLERVGPVLLFFPFFTDKIRIFTVFCYWFMHTCFGLCMELGIFPWVSNAALLLFLPKTFWDKLFSSFPNLLTTSSSPARLAEAPAKRAVGGKISGMTKGLLAAFFLALVIALNLAGLDKLKFSLPLPLDNLARLLYLYQKWNMFSPFPSKEDGWFVIPGKLRNGKEVDLFRKGAPVRWEKPKRISDDYRNARWAKYMMNVSARHNSDHRLYYGRFLCRARNEHHPYGEQVEEFEIFFMLEMTPPERMTPVPQKMSLWKHYCFKAPDPLPS